MEKFIQEILVIFAVITAGVVLFYAFILNVLDPLNSIKNI